MSNNINLIKELRALTSAGMKSCKDALEEANWDLQKAVDNIKVKGLNIANGLSSRVATDGLVGIYNPNNATPCQIMAELNCNTDFTSNTDEFKSFVQLVLSKIADAHKAKSSFDVSSVEDSRKELISSTKENIVVRRWWIEEACYPTVLVFPYLHSNGKIGVLLTLKAPSFEASKDPAFHALGADLAMQVAAMSPLAVSAEQLSPGDVDRQKSIFETQLLELKKPQAQWAKILEGKFRKWNSEVCLLEQESVIVSKMSVKDVIKKVGLQLGGEIEVVNFTRCQVGL